MQMRWTKRHSQNAVAARARLRMARAIALPPPDREREPEFSALIGWMGTRLTVQAHGRYEFGNELPHAS